MPVEWNEYDLSKCLNDGEFIVEGKINGDGKIDIGDLSIISKHYGKNSKDNIDIWNEIKKYDLNRIYNKFNVRISKNNVRIGINIILFIH